MLDRHTTMTWAGDVGNMITSLLFYSGAMSETFNVCTNATRTWREIGEIYRSTIGLIIHPVDIKSYISLGLNRYQVIYDRMFNRICDNTKICNITHIDSNKLLTPEVGIKHSISASCYNLSSFSRIQGRMDKISQINRITSARSLKDAIKYLVGYTPALNWLAVRLLASKFEPIFEAKYVDSREHDHALQ
jgi:hypothetical protein